MLLNYQPSMPSRRVLTFDRNYMSTASCILRCGQLDAVVLEAQTEWHGGQQNNKAHKQLSGRVFPLASSIEVAIITIPGLLRSCKVRARRKVEQRHEDEPKQPGCRALRVDVGDVCPWSACVHGSLQGAG